MRELWRRTSTFNASVVNPNANGRPGGVLYAGPGAGRCNCNLVKTYPFAVSPRLGLAYQISPKTVLRAGWGLSYSTVDTFAYIGGGNSQGMGYNTINFTAPGNGVAAGKLSTGLSWDPAVLYGASYNPGLLVNPGQAVQGAPSQIDPNGGRPPRVNQWNISLQREVIANLVLEAAYVGNRAVWLNAGTWGTGTVYYNDFRGKRRPVESMSIGKRFSVRERMSLSIRAEFFNPFNRNEVVSDPSTGSPSNPPTRNQAGQLTGGFGYMNYTSISSNAVGGTYPAPRTGQIIARFEF